MDDKKIIELNIKKKEEPLEQKASSSFHTNPIVNRMLSYSFDNKKQKFKFKDLFR